MRKNLARNKQLMVLMRLTQLFFNEGFFGMNPQLLRLGSGIMRTGHFCQQVFDLIKLQLNYCGFGIQPHVKPLLNQGKSNGKLKGNLFKN